MMPRFYDVSATPMQKVALITVLGSLGGDKPLATVRAALADANPEVHAAAVEAFAGWPDLAAATDLLEMIRSTAKGAERDLAFRGYVRMVRESDIPDGDKLRRLSLVSSLAAGSPEKMLVLAGFGDVISGESMKSVLPYLEGTTVVEEAGAVAGKIAGKLDAKHAAEIGSALNRVLKSARSTRVLVPARQRLEQLKLPVQ